MSTESIAVPRALTRSILAGECVAFVGAGFSAPAIPTWASLLERVARDADVKRGTRSRVGQLLARQDSMDLEAAAELLRDDLGAEGLVGALRNHLAVSEPDASMRLRLAHLRGIPFRAILTTNFDALLDGDAPGPTAYRKLLRPSGLGWFQERYLPRGDGPPVIKLHGCVERAPGDVVFTRRDYRQRLYGNPSYTTFLRSVFAANTLLFLGCSFSDVYVNELRSEVLALFEQRERDEPLAYALVADEPPARVDFFRHHEGIELLSYPSDRGLKHGAFDRFLEDLHARTNPLLHLGRLLHGRRILWHDPNPSNNTFGIEVLRKASAGAGGDHELVEVTDVEAALNAMAHHDIDLVLTHWGHGPSQSNAERLLEEMHARGLSAPVLIFATARYADENKRRALKAGALGYCYRWPSLLRTIATVLDDGHTTG